MKTDNLITLGLVAAAVWMVTQTKKTTTTSAMKRTGSGTGNTYGATEIFNSAGGAFDNGWRYFSDGTTISPSGDYYYGGSMVYQAPNNTASMGGASGSWI